MSFQRCTIHVYKDAFCMIYDANLYRYPLQYCLMPVYMHGFSMLYDAYLYRYPLQFV
jgi:hypothetical protein